MNECYDNKVVCLAFLFNEDMYYKFIESHLGAKKIVIIDNYIEQFEWIAKRFSKIQFVEYDDKIKFNKMPHFDVTIMNPPYDGKGEPLYLQILDKAFENSTKTICICPSQWTYCVPTNKFYEKYKLKFKNSLTDYINAGNEFEAGLGNNAAIYILDKNANNCVDIEELKWTRFKNQKLTKSIYEKFIKYCNIHKSIVSSCKNEKGKYYVTLPKIRGHYYKGTYLWDWPTLLSEDAMKNFDRPKDLSYKFWSFNTVKECENFVSYLNNDIILFLMYITKTDRNIHFIHIENIPMLNTFTHSWTTNELAKEFGFTKEELEYIIEEMKPFGWKTKENNV